MEVVGHNAVGERADPVKLFELVEQPDKMPFLIRTKQSLPPNDSRYAVVEATMLNF
jgi:hypothetical protein